MNDDGQTLSPMAQMLAAYGGADAARHRALWAFDARLAHLARTTSEPMIGQMRLAWWNDVIDDADARKGRGEPVVDAMRATGAVAAPGLGAMIDGWEVLVVEPEIDVQGLHDYAVGRGGGLFRALAGVADAPDWLIAAGKLWALWDLSGHVGDDRLAREALTLAREIAPDAAGAAWPRGWKPLRIAFTLALQDVMADQRAPVGMPRSVAWRVLRIALVGR
ncbi:MAG: hypothetical protein I8H96_05425 [Sphingomonadaceae bacterium]|nr:hypothetical protein [Sphingomonadaceae bacterium]